MLIFFCRSKLPENPLFSPSFLFNLVLPLVAEQFLAVTIGMADTVMVTSCGEAVVSGVSLIDSFSQLMVSLFAAFATGGAVVASQYLGHNEPDRACDSAKQLMNVSVLAGLIVVLALLPFRQYVLDLLYGKIDPDVMQNASVYFLYLILSYPFLAIYNSCAALFRSMGDSRMSLKVSILMNVLNIGGNAALIYGFGMGAAGAAISTLVSRIVSALVMMFLLCQSSRQIHFIHPLRFEWNGRIVRNIFKVGIPTGIEGAVFQIGKVLVQTFMAGFGTASLAANAISNSVAGLANVPGNALGLAMIPVVGQCIGADEKKQAVYYTKKLMRITYYAVWGLSLLLFILTPQIVGIFHLSSEATGMTVVILHTFMFGSALVWPLSFGLPNALRAAGDARFTMYVSMFSMWMFRVVSSYIISVVFGLRLYGVWIGMYIDWIFRAVCFAIRFMHGRWLEKKVI